MNPICLSIKQEETGKRIKQLLQDHGYKVKDIQGAMGFETPQVVYKWLSGKSLPSLDNFVILSRLLNTSIEDILVIDGDISYYIGNFISYVIKASGRMRTAAYNVDVASDRRRRKNVPRHILYFLSIFFFLTDSANNRFCLVLNMLACKLCSQLFIMSGNRINNCLMLIQQLWVAFFLL